VGGGGGGGGGGIIKLNKAPVPCGGRMKIQEESK